MTGIAAPVIVAEMADWVGHGGGNSGIVGNSLHDYGFHVPADELPASDYSRTRDPNGSGGPYVNWRYACAGDFDHRFDETLRAMHRAVLARLMRGELPMICEFIGKPWADQPVYYWARWNGVAVLQRYTGAGHDHWSHISWYRSRVDQAAGLWTPAPTPPPPPPPPAGTHAPGTRLLYRVPTTAGALLSGPDVEYVQEYIGPRYCGKADGIFGDNTKAGVRWYQAMRGNLDVDGMVGRQTWGAMHVAWRG